MLEQTSYSNTLLIDIGNSRIKVASINAPTELIFKTEQIEQLCVWLNTLLVEHIYIANVRTHETLKPLQDMCSVKSIRLHIIQTQKQFGGLTNSYSNVSTMGVDRWLSMLACVQFKKPNFAVLMFGTAITCDIVSKGQHLGGWIIPGRHLMEQSLTQHTARVFCEQSKAHFLDVGQSTPNCVDAGCFAAAMGVVSMAEQYLRTHFEQYCIFLTGGDNKVLTALNSDAILRVENLVLQGLTCYTKPD